jgi:hypothetical protein
LLLLLRGRGEIKPVEYVFCIIGVFIAFFSFPLLYFPGKKSFSENATKCFRSQARFDCIMLCFGFAMDYLSIFWRAGSQRFGLESTSGLPDGKFSNQKSQFGYILEDLRLENVGIFYGHLEYFNAIWDIL